MLKCEDLQFICNATLMISDGTFHVSSEFGTRVRGGNMNHFCPEDERMTLLKKHVQPSITVHCV